MRKLLLGKKKVDRIKAFYGKPEFSLVKCERKKRTVMKNETQCNYISKRSFTLCKYSD